METRKLLWKLHTWYGVQVLAYSAWYTCTWRGGAIEGVVGEGDNERLDPPHAVPRPARHLGRAL